MSLAKQNAPTIPNAVVNKVINKDMTPIRAWRVHLGLTQTEPRAASAFRKASTPSRRPKNL